MGFEPVTLRYQCNALTNWAMKSLMLGAGQLCVCLENHTSIARSRVQIPLKSWIFFSGFLLNCVNHVHNCEDLSSFDFISAVLIWFKLITNWWAWVLVPTKLVERRNALAWGGGIHGNPASDPHQAPSHWTIQWNTYRPNTYLAHTKREGRMGKTKVQTGTQTASYCNNTLRRTASKQLCILVTRCPC